jgi:hypothetical protein
MPRDFVARILAGKLLTNSPVLFAKDLTVPGGVLAYRTAVASGAEGSRKEETRPKKASKGQSKIHKVMKEKKEGTLKSSSGKKVTSRKQAVAIALSEARKAGAKIPKKS